MKKMIYKLFKHLLTKEVILYVIFGVCTMILNMLAYTVLYNYFNCSNVFSTAVAWLIAVIGAYVSNRLWVFESRAKGAKSVIHEFAVFMSCRIATGVMDIAIMYISVDLLFLNEMVFKFISNVLVVVLNYIASKILIFKNEHR